MGSEPKRLIGHYIHSAILCRRHSASTNSTFSIHHKRQLIISDKTVITEYDIHINMTKLHDDALAKAAML